MNRSDREANWNGMNWIRQEKRLAIYLRDGMACAYCGTAVEAGIQLNLDHIKPVERGGTNEAENLVTCCERCNKSKGTRSMWAFCQAVAQYINHGLDANQIRAHVIQCSCAELPMLHAKQLIARRGSAAKVVAAHREEIPH